jgi:hypothetical protein
MVMLEERRIKILSNVMNIASVAMMTILMLWSRNGWLKRQVVAVGQALSSKRIHDGVVAADEEGGAVVGAAVDAQHPFFQLLRSAVSLMSK